MAALVAPLAACPPGAPDGGVIVVEDVLFVAGPHGGLLLPLQHLPVPAVLHIVLCLREDQLPAQPDKTMRSKKVDNLADDSKSGDEDWWPVFQIRIKCESI